MYPTMDGIREDELELKLDEATELSFKVVIEAPSSMKPKYRLVCEQAGSVSCVFEGRPTDDGLVRVEVPALKGVMREGRFSTRLEVIMGDRYFAPIELNAKFMQPIAVTAECVTAKPRIDAAASNKSVPSGRLASKRSLPKSSTLRDMYDRSKDR